MTREELYRRITELAIAAERERPRALDSGEAITDALAWQLAVVRLYEAAEGIRRDERRVVYRVA